jgi:DNA adenine methylase
MVAAAPLPQEHAQPQAQDLGLALPFLKTTGGKGRLLEELGKHVPERFGRYHELFVGGGALFFALGRKLGRPSPAVLCDDSELVVAAWIGVRDHCDYVLGYLEHHVRAHTASSEQHYYKSRASLPSVTDPAKRAALILYLNHVCYNGVMRVNRAGAFNVPLGSYKNPRIYDEKNLRACSWALQGVEIEHGDFESRAAKVGRGDFVYFDPPYVPVKKAGGAEPGARKTSSTTRYTAVGFTMDDQRRLRDAALGCKARGAHVLLSNSDTPEVRELYADGFELRAIQARRSVNRSAAGRGPVSELLIW